MADETSGTVRPAWSPQPPTAADCEAIGRLRTLAFIEKIGCCGYNCLTNVDAHIAKSAKVHADMAAKDPVKFSHCRVVKEEGTGQLLGCIQLQLANDVGDQHFPSDMQHNLLNGEAYLEWIACDPDATGRGVGSALIQWAHAFAKEKGAKFISLEVMRKNVGAVRLYRRKGYVVRCDPHGGPCDCLCAPCYVFFCFGCVYCGVLYMVKPLQETDN
eukprot:m.630958 g.630958  ORF g.630958 m.630958 type:complete len:215 (-) comp22568_c0_seq23:3008-3652(-)